LLRVPGEDTPDFRLRIIQELEPVFGTDARAVLEPENAVKTLMQVAAAPEPSTGSGTIAASLASLRLALHGGLDAAVHLRDVSLSCHELSRSAEAAGAGLTAFLFARLAWAAGGRTSSDPIYTYEMARLAAAAVPELASRGREWLTWAALAARRNARWEIVGLAAATLADHLTVDGDEVAAGRLRQLAMWATDRAPSNARRTDKEERG
jgi:hypothetical protein